MSVVDRVLSGIKDVLLLREQMSELREDVKAMNGDIAGLVGDIRDLDRRVARLEGSDETMRTLIAGSIRRLPGR